MQNTAKRHVRSLLTTKIKWVLHFKRTHSFRGLHDMLLRRSKQPTHTTRTKLEKTLLHFETWVTVHTLTWCCRHLFDSSLDNLLLKQLYRTSFAITTLHSLTSCDTPIPRDLLRLSAALTAHAKSGTLAKIRVSHK